MPESVAPAGCPAPASTDAGAVQPPKVKFNSMARTSAPSILKFIISVKLKAAAILSRRFLRDLRRDRAALFSGPAQGDHLRCSRRIVVDDQISHLKRGIRRSEGHRNLAALSRRQRFRALFFHRKWREGRLTGDHNLDLGTLRAAVLDRYSLGFAGFADLSVTAKIHGIRLERQRTQGRRGCGRRCGGCCGRRRSPGRGGRRSAAG